MLKVSSLLSSNSLCLPLFTTLCLPLFRTLCLLCLEPFVYLHRSCSCFYSWPSLVSPAGCLRGLCEPKRGFLENVLWERPITEHTASGTEAIKGTRIQVGIFFIFFLFFFLVLIFLVLGFVICCSILEVMFVVIMCCMDCISNILYIFFVHRKTGMRGDGASSVASILLVCKLEVKFSNCNLVKIVFAC